MQSIITMELLAAVSDNGFSVDELVHELGRISQDKGLPGIAVLILKLMDELLHRRHLNGQAWSHTACCEHPAYRSLGFAPRELRTSIGLLEFSWRRYKCQRCGKVLVPLRDFLGLERYQSCTNELEQIVVETVTDQSYRRSSDHLEAIGGIPVPKSTAHRWIAQTQSDQLERPTEELATLMADGTGYKRRPQPALGVDNKGMVRMAIGITPGGGVRPLGTWSGASWEQIAADLGVGLEEGQPLAGMLVSDGERGLAEALGPLTREQQRCLWHVSHDLSTPMWEDGARQKVRRKAQGRLAELVRIELPAQDGQPVSDQDRQRVQEQIDRAQEGVRELAAELAERGYERAATYVDQARSRLFGYLRFWLKHGIINPKVTSFIERLMREVGRRLKRIAFGWRPENAAKMAGLILKRITDPLEWEQYWKKRLRLEGNVLFAFRGVKSSPPTSGR